jgi:hypothetical protein
MNDHMKSLIALVTVLAVLVGCQQKASSENDNSIENNGGNQKLYEEVMAVHDEVMPRMDDMYKLKQKLKAQLLDSTASDERQKEIQTAIKNLDVAGDGMMEWMRNFDPIPDSLGEEKARNYLLTEKEKIQSVKDKMLLSIDAAKALQ